MAIYQRYKVASKAPGVGKKTAERIVLELRDKVEISAIEDITEDIELVDDEQYKLTSLDIV